MRWEIRNRGSVLELCPSLGEVTSTWCVSHSLFLNGAQDAAFSTEKALKEWLRAPIIPTNRKYPLVELEHWKRLKAKDGDTIPVYSWKTEESGRVLCWIWLMCSRFCWSKFKPGNNFPLFPFVCPFVWLPPSGLRCWNYICPLSFPQPLCAFILGVFHGVGNFMLPGYSLADALRLELCQSWLGFPVLIFPLVFPCGWCPCI